MCHNSEELVTFHAYIGSLTVLAAKSSNGKIVVYAVNCGSISYLYMAKRVGYVSCISYRLRPWGNKWIKRWKHIIEDYQIDGMELVNNSRPEKNILVMISF